MHLRNKRKHAIKIRTVTKRSPFFNELFEQFMHAQFSHPKSQRCCIKHLQHLSHGWQYTGVRA